MHQVIAEVTRVDFEAACERAGMIRTKQHHPDDPEFKHCRSDIWQGDLLIFALEISRRTRASQDQKLDFTGVPQ